MEHLSYEFKEYVNYCGFDNLPEGLEQFFAGYREKEDSHFIERSFLTEVFERFSLPAETREMLTRAAEAVEADEKLFYFSKFLVWDMCSARNRCDVDNYSNMTPLCMQKYRELYSFLLLLACVVPSRRLLEERGVPEHYYEDIPFRPMEPQLEKLVQGDMTVSDFPWDMNFYTCSIFLMDRFLFIPCRFGDAFTMYRNKTSGKVTALWQPKEEFRRDGQLNGTNGIYDTKEAFTSIWEETENSITANPINPMGFVERAAVTLSKEEWTKALSTGDMLLALHVPSGPGYTPERLKNSMLLALEFYRTYFPELPVKGFWSESWLYDSRLSLVLDNETSNIIKVQRQFYLYPVREGDAMLRYEVFGDWKADEKKIELKTSLQKAAAAYMTTGARFNNLSMIVLKEEADKTDRMPYITEEDIDRFRQVVDSHLR
ncbi:acyltransferase domain-containing protein [Anaerocolumna xylanovorans]|uniref:GNAT-like C-terminal domain-containing protein n=1 Tax=Anaerocolumna xylanovorans DSM 12503 TaxID=1121345 RepID=A0A1M7Y702_9FIRM|nr:acyltransferase domain-containing protein [Anaerocolumna xylanovorans]SHO48390.1 hypothetical protein SAMN02745217_01818 [Anaerocolumna xylanovorans DSM 12503]